ncbi:hypothetical protein [Halorientalis sp.]|uniref:hypothetical protein n=1 Tax=Halorientalis sp. TaxID=1931229 RepID=UPI002611A38E|nr:hypothetical protein [Halorientalis sp.]
MSHHGTGFIGRVFDLQRRAIREGRMAVWNALVFQRRIDDAVLAGLKSEAATRTAAVELCTDAVRDGADRLDDTLPSAASVDERSPLRRLAARPLDALVAANAAAGDTFLSAADEAFDRYERGLRTVLLALNRRVNALLVKHEALERRLREYVEHLDDDRAEQVAEFRRQLSTLQTDLRTMQGRLVRDEPEPEPAPQ